MQELLGGPETQAEDAAGEESPDEDAEAWWGDPADADSSTDQEHVPYWERLARQIEREY